MEEMLALFVLASPTIVALIMIALVVYLRRSVGLRFPR